MSGPYQGRDLSNCGVGRLRVAINCGVLSVKQEKESMWGHYHLLRSSAIFHEFWMKFVKEAVDLQHFTNMLHM